MTVFTPSHTLLEAIDQARTSSSIRVAYKIDGFWSRDSISIYGHRTYRDEWTFTISRSSGGRDTDEIESEAIAARNYAAALIHAADLVDELKENVDALDENYEIYMEACRQEEAEREAAYQAKLKLEEDERDRALAADPGIDGSLVQHRLEQAMKETKYRAVSLALRRRTEEATTYSGYDHVELVKTDSGRTSYYIAGKRVAKSKFAPMVTDKYAEII